ncbi:MAG: translation initiation factor [Thermoproteota archaeon]|nr:translation initiation factor [Thermoproteota archaeon]
MSRPTDVGDIKIGHHILIDNEPCKVVEYEKSKPGKHGAAKARIVAIGVFDGGKRSIVSPVDARVDVPIIEKRSGQIVSISDNSIQLMDLETFEIFFTTMPPEEELKSKISAGAEVEYWKVFDRTKIMRVKGNA